MNKKITVILPTYNGASRENGIYLKKAIESVLNQTYTNLELVIVNDGSTDETELICLEYDDERIKYVYQQNKGLSGARNRGIEESKGEYLTFLDDDDIFYPDKLLEQYNYLETHNANVVYCFADKIDTNDKKIADFNHKNSGDLLETLLYHNILNSPASVMLSRKAIAKTGLFKEYLKSCEDWDYWIRLSSKYLFYCLEKSLLGYRIHSSSQMSRNREKMEFYDFVVLMENLMELGIEDKDKYLHNLYQRFTKIDYGIKDFKRFQQNYKIAGTYASHDLEWRVKYWLSCFPLILNFVYFIYNKESLAD